jgi:hypothetical protein
MQKIFFLLLYYVCDCGGRRVSSFAGHRSFAQSWRVCQDLNSHLPAVVQNCKEYFESLPTHSKTLAVNLLARTPTVALRFSDPTAVFRSANPNLQEAAQPAIATKPGLLVLGLNPAWQTILRLSDLDLGQVNRAEAAQPGTGGKGQNAAKAAAIVLKFRARMEAQLNLASQLLNFWVELRGSKSKRT